MNEHHHLEPQTVNLKLAFIGVGLVAAVSATLFLGAHVLNQHRYNSVLADYTTETEQLIQSNATHFAQLYHQAFLDCSIEYQNYPLDRYNNKPRDIICEAAKTALANIQFGDTRDTSAIAYLQYTNGKVELIEASGKYTPATSIDDSYQLSYNHRVELQQYFDQGKTLKMWDDHINYIRGKEVIVPVVVNQQKVGYIFRGVIEK